MRFVHPDGGRILWALFVASLVTATPALLAGIYALAVFPAAFMVTLGHALLLGAPLYYLLRSRFPIDWGQAMLAGGLIGVGPAALVTLWALAGAPTDLGINLQYYWPFPALGGFMGTIGGIVFRAVLGPPRIEREIEPGIFE